MSSVTKSVEERYSENPNIDNQANFDALWEITCEMFEKVKDRFELTLDPCCEGLMPYTGANNARGSLSAFAGPEIDWLIHSYTGNPKASFTNMHLTINLGPQIDVPNFGFALGTIPHLFWYQDYMPRRELVMDPDYANKYWDGSANERFLSMFDQKEFSPFISRDVFTRVALSPGALCYSAPTHSDNIDLIRKVSHAALDQWMGWVDEATPIPVEEREALAARDEFIRKNVCEKDPANVVAVKLFGEELTDRLVSTLWGGTRTLPRSI